MFAGIIALSYAVIVLIIISIEAVYINYKENENTK